MKSLHEFDRRLNELGQSLPIIIVPGANDPTNSALPQAAVKRGLLQSSGLYETLHLLPNPSWIDIEGHSILLTSGPILDDMLRYARDPSKRLDLATLWLKARHLAPSAPDTQCKMYSRCGTPNICRVLPFLRG